LWNPDFSQLKRAEVWLAAAGQVFFTLSVGFGCVVSYASYLRRRDDVVVTGLSTVSTNEVAEIVLGGTIAIPAAFVFFGLAGTTAIAKSGSFNLGFVAMPAVFAQMPAGSLLGLAWFLLLFIAGITSSVALCQPAITFLEDELGWSHTKAVRAVMLGMAVAAHVPVIGLRFGALDELDFWAGKVGIAMFGLIEIVVFMWIFGGRRAWDEIHEGAEVRLPRAFYYIFRYVTPLVMGAILTVWVLQTDASFWTMAGKSPAERAWGWAARLMILSLFALAALMVRFQWKEKKEEIL
jgi:SNF family Na+-dependent transporter